MIELTIKSSNISWVNQVLIAPITDEQYKLISDNSESIEEMDLEYEQYFLPDDLPVVSAEDVVDVTSKVSDDTYEMVLTESGQYYHLKVIGGRGGSTISSEDHSQDDLLEAVSFQKIKVLIGEGESQESFLSYEIDCEVAEGEEWFNEKTENHYVVGADGVVDEV